MIIPIICIILLFLYAISFAVLFYLSDKEYDNFVLDYCQSTIDLAAALSERDKYKKELEELKSHKTSEEKTKKIQKETKTNKTKSTRKTVKKEGKQ